ncbi:unnamed protein product [Tuber aestivum]|uniref:Uncharacterized protein n=1 Tax=Tuber aestivum TaxID=59557 RepID=A0A292PLE8_9PEZI|nr:unnamed protein product [Tuber aestivum]
MDLLRILTSMSRLLLLSPALFILRLVIGVFLPVIIIGNYLTSLVFGMLSLPFVVFSRLQELYIFCGVAAVIGISTGAILGLASYFLTDTLDFCDEPVAPRPGQTRLKNGRIRGTTGRTITTTATGTVDTKMPARVLFPQAIPTILEEEDEDSPFLVGSGSGKRREGRGKRAARWSSEDEEEGEGEDESSG